VRVPNAHWQRPTFKCGWASFSIANPHRTLNLRNECNKNGKLERVGDTARNGAIHHRNMSFSGSSEIFSLDDWPEVAVWGYVSKKEKKKKKKKTAQESVDNHWTLQP
jgi:hypothetical protein